MVDVRNALLENSVILDDRKQEEVDFHNQRELHRQSLDRQSFEKKYANKKWYSVTRTSEAYVSDWLRNNCPGKTALDYCCGLGGMSLRIAENGAFVHGIDISDESVTTSAKRLHDAGYGDACNMQVMDAENLTFDDDFFDVIVCSGVLHHLDLERAYPELSRALKPTGKILCIEAVGHNPFIRAYRKLTPHLRTSWEVDHILKMKDLRQAGDYFDGIHVKFFHLFAIGAIPFRKTPLFHPVLSAFDALDRIALRIPGLRTMAWQMVFELSAPKVSCLASGNTRTIAA